MASNRLVQARIDGSVKEEAATVLGAMGLTVSDAVRLLLTKVAREKALPFAPLVPNAVTIEAMKEARLGGLPGLPACRICSTICMRTIERTVQFKRDYKRESRAGIGRTLMPTWCRSWKPWPMINHWNLGITTMC